jgi:charged multivesicular body protein 4
MSGWGLGWFGGGQAKKEAPKKAILQLRGQLEMLNKREKHLQNQMDEQDTIARKYVSSNKAGKLTFFFVKVEVRDGADGK